MRMRHWAIGVTLLLALAGCGEEPQQVVIDAVEETGPRPLIVLGIDGATWELIEPWARQGLLPNFKRLMEEGAWGTLRAYSPYKSPVLWTTMATGVPPRVHGVLDFVQPYGARQTVPVDMRLRKAPAVWTIASAAGRDVAVISYYATWPVEKVNGVMLSDRLELGLAGSIWPADSPLLENAEPSWANGSSEEVQVLRRFLRFDYDTFRAGNRDNPDDFPHFLVSKRLDLQLRRDEWVRNAGLEVLGGRPDLAMLYLRGVDHSSHAFWQYMDGQGDETVSSEHRRMLGDVVLEIYRWMDETIGLILLGAGDANLVVVSDHGFGTQSEDWIELHPDQAFLSGGHRPNGIIAAIGPDIRPIRLEGANIYDVAPTLLALQGLPVGLDMPGRVLEETMTDSFAADHPVASVARHQAAWTLADIAGSESGDVDEAMEILRSLGYLGTADGTADSGGLPSVPFWEVPSAMLRDLLLGEARHLADNALLERLHDLADEIDRHDSDGGHLGEVVRHRVTRTSPTASRVALDPPTLPADGRSQTLLTVIVRDKSGWPMDHERFSVLVRAEGNDRSGVLFEEPKRDHHGVFRIPVTAGLLPGRVMLTVTVKGGLDGAVDLKERRTLVLEQVDELPWTALEIGRDTMESSSGGAVPFRLMAPRELAGRPYLLLASASGTEPGLQLDGLTLPLNPDELTTLSAELAGQRPFVSTRGILNAKGEAAATIHLRPRQLKGLAGHDISFAFLVDNPPAFASNPVNLRITRPVPTPPH